MFALSIRNGAHAFKYQMLVLNNNNRSVVFVFKKSGFCNHNLVLVAKESEKLV